MILYLQREQKQLFEIQKNILIMTKKMIIDSKKRKGKETINRPNNNTCAELKY